MLALVVHAACGCKRERVIQSGDEIFATAAEVVLQVSLKSASESVVARRASSDESFTYRFERDGEVRNCGPSKARNQALQRTFSIKALTVFDDARTDALMALPPAAFVQLQVGATGDPIEPFRLDLSPAQDPSSPRVDALLRSAKEAFAVDSSLLDLLEQRCP